MMALVPGIVRVSLVASLLGLGCSTPREPRPDTPPAVSVAPVASGGDERRMNDEHFVFEGPGPERASARARVARALAKDAALPNHPTSYSPIPDLVVFLDHHYVRVTPEKRILRVSVNPATADASWEMFFTVTEDDRAIDITIAQLEPPPPRAR